MTDKPDILDQAIDAALALAGERPWREVSLREIAERAERRLRRALRQGAGQAAAGAAPLQRLDRAALATAATPSDDVHDRLFDATMARVEAMERASRGADRRWPARRRRDRARAALPAHRPGHPGSGRRRPRRRRASPP